MSETGPVTTLCKAPEHPSLRAQLRSKSRFRGAEGQPDFWETVMPARTAGRA